MKKRSVWAVVAGVLVIIVVTTLVDIALHVASRPVLAPAAADRYRNAGSAVADFEIA